MQVGSTVWNGDKAGVVLSNDESGVTVGYFESIETLTSDADNPSPLSSSPTVDDEAAAPVATWPPPPAEKPAQVPADSATSSTSSDVVEVDPLAALTADERATYNRLQGKLDSASSGA